MELLNNSQFIKLIYIFVQSIKFSNKKPNKMALQLSASIYGANQNSWNVAQGRTMSFPTQGIVMRNLNPAETYSGVVCNTAIQLLPTAPSPIQPVYYTPTAIATLVTAANA